MAVRSKNVQLRGAQRRRATHALAQLSVELRHQFAGESVVKAPQTLEHRTGACVEEGTRETDRLISRHDDGLSAFTCAQGDEVAVERQIQAVQRCQTSVRQSQV